MQEPTTNSEPQIHTPSDQHRMELTDEEREWAFAIKDAAFEDSDLLPKPDFWYAQLAIVALLEHGEDDREGLTASALERLHALQAFRQEYRADDTFDGALSIVQEFFELFPHHVLSFSFHSSDGRYVFVADQAAMNIRFLGTTAQQTMYMKHLYAFFTAFNPDFFAIRNGAHYVLECDGFDWAKHMTANLHKRIYTELAVYYPTSFACIKSFHTGVFYNMIYSMIKPYLPSRISSKIELGCQSEERLDTLYLVPNPQIAMERQLQRFEAALRMRYHHEETFVL